MSVDGIEKFSNEIAIADLTPKPGAEEHYAEASRPDSPSNICPEVLPQNIKEYDLTAYDQLSITILSDTHGALDPAICQMANQGDVVLHAGDIMGGSVLADLRPKLNIVIAVKGNNDYPMNWAGQDHGRLGSIPDVAVVQCCGGTISMEHGHQIQNIERDHFQLAYKYPDSRLVVYGHTHFQRIDQDALPWLLNPGAAGLERNKGGASCSQLRITMDGWQLEHFKFPQCLKVG